MAFENIYIATDVQRNKSRGSQTSEFFHNQSSSWPGKIAMKSPWKTIKSQANVLRLQSQPTNLQKHPKPHASSTTQKIPARKGLSSNSDLEVGCEGTKFRALIRMCSWGAFLTRGCFVFNSPASPLLLIEVRHAQAFYFEACKKKYFVVSKILPCPL